MYIVQDRFVLPPHREPKQWSTIHRDSGGLHATEAEALAKAEEFRAKYPAMEFRVIAA